MTVPLRVALATCAEYPNLDDDDQLLRDALTARGAVAVPMVWNAPGDWGDVDLVVIRQTWDYAERRDEFLAWVDEVSAQTSIANHPELVRWSTDKHYLRDLVAAGVPCVPTTFHEPGDPWSVPADGEYVVKPAISAGSRNTARYGPGDETRAIEHITRLHAEGRSVMIQPYLSSVDQDGETALLYFEGRFSHAARKGPLLVRNAYMTDALFLEETITPTTATEEQRRVSEAALAVAARVSGGHPLLYARVDLIGDTAPVVLELELVEPSTFLRTDPGAADRFAEAILRTPGMPST
ncbi:MAG: hypothetical protein FJW97_10380 [Actinobacteria bacterium]|nr:hypothetical protein [Actinomycetota bacterium]